MYCKWVLPQCGDQSGFWDHNNDQGIFLIELGNI